MRSKSTFGTAALAVCAAAAAAAASVPASASASAYLTDRFDLVLTSAQVQRWESSATSPLISQDVYSNFDTFNGVLPSPHTISTSGSGSLMDTATGLALVSAASGSIDATSTLSYDGDSNLNLYTVTGHYQSSMSSAALEGYLPPEIDPETFPYLTTGPIYNAGLRFLITDIPADFTLTVGQTNSVGAFVINAAMLYKDFNDDGNFNEADGDVAIVTDFNVSGIGTNTATGTLQPSATPYRLTFFGNSYDGTFDNNMTMLSSTDYNSSFSLSVPEPGSIAGVALLSVTALRRRRTPIR